MFTRKSGKVILIICIVVVMATTLFGCANLKSWFQSIKGELIGNRYTVWEYDNFGNKILTIHGNKIALEGGTDSLGENSSYIDITNQRRKAPCFSLGDIRRFFS